MFELISENKNKLFKILNFLLLISFFWVVFINSSYFFEKIIYGNHEHFYDLKLIHDSFIETLNGIDTYVIFPPYYNQPTTSLPPYLVDLFKSFGYLDFSLFTKIFVFFQIISIGLIFFYSYKLFPLKNIKYFYPIIYFFCFNFSLGLSTVVGNIAVILYGIISLGIFYLYKKRVFLFCLLIFIASLFKFYLIIFYFLPILLFGFRYLKIIVFFSLTLFFINFIYFINNPEIYKSWVNLMNIQLSRTPNNPWIGSDITHAFASIISKTVNFFFNINYYPSSLLSNFFYFFTTGISFLLVFLIYNPKFKKNESFENKLKMISLGLLLIFLFYPKLMIYDFFIIVPAYYYLIKKIDFSLNQNTNFFIKLFLFVLFLCVQDTHAGLCSLATLFFLICFLENKNKDPLKLNNIKE